MPFEQSNVNFIRYTFEKENDDDNDDEDEMSQRTLLSISTSDIVSFSSYQARVRVSACTHACVCERVHTFVRV